MAVKNTGTVVQVIGPVLDIRFADGSMPDLLNDIEVEHNGNKVVAEVAQHIGDDVVRCIAMSSTDGLERGISAVDTGGPITVPVGEQCLGRIFNLLGEHEHCRLSLNNKVTDNHTNRYNNPCIRKSCNGLSQIITCRHKSHIGTCQEKH